ncbi:hypothetical protein VTH06DRAFT_6781 [Thermothelomyces fergusii]
MPAAKLFPAGIKLVHSPEHAAVDIVFVHGLTGDRERTWTARGAHEPWPKTLLPPELPTARILTFGYDANVIDWRGLGPRSRIGDHSWNLLSSLATYRDHDDANGRPIIFVCNGFGGLVCKDFHAMVCAKEKEDQGRIEITCFFAELPFPVIGPGVPHSSAVLPEHIQIGIHKNQRDIARFVSADDPGFTAVCGELRRWMKQIGVQGTRGLRRRKSAPAVVSPPPLPGLTRRTKSL